jgi:hypothetical protein
MSTIRNSPDFSALREIEEEILFNCWNSRFFADKVRLGSGCYRLFDGNFVQKFSVRILDCIELFLKYKLRMPENLKANKT